MIDNNHKLLTDASHKLLTDPSHKLLTDASNKLLTDASHKLLTVASHNLLADASHKLLTDASLLTDCLAPSSPSLSPVSLPACLCDYFTNLFLHDPRSYLDSCSSLGKVKQPFKFKFTPLFVLRILR